MTTCCGASGLFGRFGTDVGSKSMSLLSSASYAWPFMSGGASLSAKKKHVNAADGGTNGTTGQDAELTRLGLEMVDGDVNLALSPDSFQYFGWRALGGMWGVAGENPATAPALANTSYPKISNLTDGTSHIEGFVHRDTKVFGYGDLAINQLTISGSVGEMVKMTISFVGTERFGVSDESIWPASLTTSLSVPYMFEDVVLRINGTDYKMRSFQFVRNNQLAPRYFGSRFPCGFLPNGMPQTNIRLQMPACDDVMNNIFLYAAPPSYLDVKLIFTHPTSAYSARISMPGVQIPTEDPPIAAGEMLIDFNGMARRVGGAPEVSFFSDNT